MPNSSWNSMSVVAGWRDEADAEEHAAEQHDDARAEAIGQDAPQEGRSPHAQEIERCGGGNAAARPAGVGGYRLQEDGEREHGADADAGHQHAAPTTTQPYDSFMFAPDDYANRPARIVNVRS
jgi:hypothetical protein